MKNANEQLTESYTTEPLFSTPICDKIERTKQEVDISRK